MNVMVEENWYTESMMVSNPLNIYVYGDNAARVGKGGQASIREHSNSVGVATKRTPDMGEMAFFSGTSWDLQTLLTDLFNLERMHSDPKFNKFTLVFPKDGLGTGLAKLPETSPYLYDVLSKFIFKFFNVETLEDGSLQLVK